MKILDYVCEGLLILVGIHFLWFYIIPFIRMILVVS
jgi:hypothetical protein